MVTQQAEKLRWAYDAAYNLLTEQFDFGGTFDSGSEGQRRFNSAFGFGYAFGFTGITDQPATLAAISVAFTRLFSVDRGSRIVDECLRIQDEPEFRAARLLGAQEIRAWLAHPHGATPLSVSQYLLGNQTGAGEAASS